MAFCQQCGRQQQKLYITGTVESSSTPYSVAVQQYNTYIRSTRRSTGTGMLKVTGI